jgi:FMN phosphatase YigB (HAD superfamily)
VSDDIGRRKGIETGMSDNRSSSIVFLVDVDNTLLDNDGVREDFQEHLEREFGSEYRERYWTIQEAMFVELGYRDYLGALQRFRLEHPFDVRLLSMGVYLMDYPFAGRLFPGALEVLERFRAWGRPVILSDGDAVFQPRKVERAGLARAVNGEVLIYLHKEEAFADIERRYPADHYVLVDDKLQILSAAKKAWRQRVTTVFPRQGTLAHDPHIIASNPAADLTVERIGDLLSCDLSALHASSQSIFSMAEARR